MNQETHSTAYFWERLSKWGKQPAVSIQGFETLTYRELVTQCEAVEKSLGSQRRLILFCMDNSSASIIAYLSALRSRHVILMADSEDVELQQNLKHTYQPDAVFYPQQGLQLISEPSAGSFYSELALLMSTSGSTGNSKCVRLSYENIQANAESIAEYLRINNKDKALLTLPLHYCYGLSVLNSHLLQGASIYAGLNSMTNSNFNDLLKEQSISSFACVPYQVEMLERNGFRNHKYPDLKYITQAGGRLASGLVKQYSEWADNQGKKFFVMYGQTEATARMAYMPPERVRANPHCMGVAIPGGQFHLQNEDGELIEGYDIQGELVYRGPNVMLGYANSVEDLQLGRQVQQLHTGDLACRTCDDLFYIVGRNKRFCKIYGKRLNMDAVERFLHEQFASAVCVSDDITLFLVSEGMELEEATLTLVADRYRLLDADIKLSCVEKYPLLASGKIDYQTLLQTVCKNEQDSSDITETVKQTTEQQLLAIFQKHFKQSEVGLNDSFVCLNGDSLRYVAVSMDIETVLGTLPDNWEQLSITEMAKQVNERSNSSTAEIEMSVFLRFIATLLVVINHAGLSMFAGGAALLLVVSGYNFARFNMDKLLLGRGADIIKQFFSNVLIPFWLIVAGFSLLKGGEIPVYNLLLINNWLNLDTLVPFGTWFIQALLQCMLLVILFFSIPAMTRLYRENNFNTVVLLLGFAVMIRVLDAYVLHEYLPRLNGGQLSWVFWLFILGMLFTSCKTQVHRILMSVFTILAPWLFFSGDYSRIAIISLGGLALLWLSQMQLPALMKKPIGLISSSSLFIYMLHPRAPINSMTSDWTIDVIRIIIGVLLGVVTWLIYQRVQDFLQQIFRK